MKTIHVNITSKKMYIFTTSELLLFYLQIKYSMTTNFGLLERLVFINEIVAFCSGVVWWWCVCFSRRHLVRYRLCTASLWADVGVRRLDGEWRGQSLVTLADGPCMNICVIKKKVSEPDGWLLGNLTAAKKHHAADPLVRSSGPRRLEEKKEKHKWRDGKVVLCIWAAIHRVFPRLSQSAASLCARVRNANMLLFLCSDCFVFHPLFCFCLFFYDLHVGHRKALRMNPRISKMSPESSVVGRKQLERFFGWAVTLGAAHGVRSLLFWGFTTFKGLSTLCYTVFLRPLCGCLTWIQCRNVILQSLAGGQSATSMTIYQTARWWQRGAPASCPKV